MDMKRYVLRECLEKLGFTIISKDVVTQENGNIIQKYANLAYAKALQQKRDDVLDNLEAAGLIYGF